MTRSLFAAAALGVVLRLAFSLGYWTGQPLTRDEREYLSLARSLASGNGFVYDRDVATGGVDPFGRAPGYPAFLAMAGGGGAPTESVPTPVKVAQSLAGGLGVVLVGLLANRLAGATAGRMAALAAACYPPLVWIAGYAYSEALAWPIGLAAVAIFDRAARGSGDTARNGAMLAAGAAAGVAVLIRPALLLFLAMAAIWLLTRRSWQRAAVFVVAAALVIGPWTIRNYRHYQRLVLVASEGGVTFWTGNHPLAIGDGDFAANPQLRRESLALRARHPELSEEQMEPVYYQEAFAWIAAHPLQWLALEGRKIFYLVVPVGPSYRLHSLRYYAASVLSYALVLPAALVGFWRIGARRGRTPGLWLLAASAVLACLIFFPQERFRIPVIDPVLIVCASGVFLAESANERSGRSVEARP